MSFPQIGKDMKSEKFKPLKRGSLGGWGGGGGKRPRLSTSATPLGAW